MYLEFGPRRGAWHRQMRRQRRTLAPSPELRDSVRWVQQSCGPIRPHESSGPAQRGPTFSAAEKGPGDVTPAFCRAIARSWRTPAPASPARTTRRNRPSNPGADCSPPPAVGTPVQSVRGCAFPRSPDPVRRATSRSKRIPPSVNALRRTGRGRVYCSPRYDAWNDKSFSKDANTYPAKA